MLQEPKDLGRRLEMAWTVTSPATVTQPVAHALDAPNGRSDYPLVRPAPLSPRKSDRAVTRAIERLSDLRLTATVVRVDLACGPVSCRDLAMTLRSDMLLAEHRPGVGLVVLYIGPRPAGPNCEATVEARDRTRTDARSAERAALRPAVVCTGCDGASGTGSDDGRSARRGLAGGGLDPPRGPAASGGLSFSSRQTAFQTGVVGAQGHSAHCHEDQQRGPETVVAEGRASITARRR